MSIKVREVIEIFDDEVPEREVIEILDDEVPEIQVPEIQVPEREVIEIFDDEVQDRYMGVNYIRNRDIDIYIRNSEEYNVVFEVNY